MSYDVLMGGTRRDWSRGSPPADATDYVPKTRRTSTGSVLLPAKQQRAISIKVDDVRYDLRQAGRNVGTAVLVLSAALGAVALASVYRTSSGK